MDHTLLWERARETSFPLACVAVALNQYKGWGHVGLSGVAQDALFPTRGIAAGRGLATTFTQV